MNEIKRQLNEHLGDTKERADKVMTQIEQQKRRKQPKNRMPWLVGFVTVAAALGLFFLINNGATNDEPTDQVSTTPSYKEQLREFFKEDGDIAYFEGEGNEFLTTTETTNWLSNDYVQLLTDNGATVVQSIYKITDDQILLIYEEAESEEMEFTAEELDALESKSVLLQWPLETTTFDGKTMTPNVTFETPYNVFADAVEVKNDTANGTEKHYYAKGYGLIGFEYEDAATLEVVSSKLKSINEEITEPTVPVDATESDQQQQEPQANESNAVESETVEKNVERMTVFNKTDGTNDQYDRSKLTFLPVGYAGDMTYERLYAKEEHTFGLFAYNCKGAACSYTFEHKAGGVHKNLLSTMGEMVKTSTSPDGKYIVVQIEYEDSVNGSSIFLDSLIVLNTETYDLQLVEDNPDYFNVNAHPIETFTWTGGRTLVLTVADLPNLQTESIIAWEKSDKKTKQVTVKLP